MTTVITQNPVRADVIAHTDEPAQSGHSRRWALAGVGAGIAALGTLVTSSMVDVVYRDAFGGDTHGVAAALAEKAPLMFVFHSITVLAAVLMIVFAAGLHRRLRSAAPQSIAPVVAFFGLAGTAVVSVLGTGLDTEYMMPLAAKQNVVDDNTAAMYNHWIGTIPWVWVLVGLAGLAVYAVARQGGAPRWMGRVGLVLGGLTLVLGISPLEYMALIPGVLWLLATSIGLVVGDRRHRDAV